MSDWYEENFIEPDTSIHINGGVKANIALGFDVSKLDKAISEYIENRFVSRISEVIEKRVKECFYAEFPTREHVLDAFDNILQKRIEDKYPEIVENKTNEFVEALKNYKTCERNDRWKNKKMVQAAHKQVDDYIENELKESVRKTKEQIEIFAENYFAKNLFKGMALMNKMLDMEENKEE